MPDENRPTPTTPADPMDWEAACAAYYPARQEHEVFLDQVLGPAWRMAKDGGCSSHIAELQRQGDDLCEARHDALRRLVLLPVADVGALRVKVRLAYDEVLQFSDAEGFLRAILTDLDRLAS